MQQKLTCFGLPTKKPVISIGWKMLNKFTNFKLLQGFFRNFPRMSAMQRAAISYNAWMITRPSKRQLHLARTVQKSLLLDCSIQTQTQTKGLLNLDINSALKYTVRYPVQIKRNSPELTTCVVWRPPCRSSSVPVQFVSQILQCRNEFCFYAFLISTSIYFFERWTMWRYESAFDNRSLEVAHISPSRNCRVLKAVSVFIRT